MGIKVIKILRGYILITIAVIAIRSNISFADTEMYPASYAITTSDGRYIFVNHPAKGGFYGGKSDPELLARYPKSGLYKNDGGRELLWTVDWSAASGVYISSDGVSLIRLGPWPVGSPVIEKNIDLNDLYGKAKHKEPFALYEPDEKALHQLAIAFYNKGVLVKEYSIGDLVKNPGRLPKSVSHFRWIRDSAYDDKKGRITITTYDDQKFVFDKTGNMIAQMDK